MHACQGCRQFIHRMSLFDSDGLRSANCVSLGVVGVPQMNRDLKLEMHVMHFSFDTTMVGSSIQYSQAVLVFVHIPALQNVHLPRFKVQAELPDNRDAEGRTATS